MVSTLGFSQDSNQNSESNFNVEFIEHKVKRKQTLYKLEIVYKVCFLLTICSINSTLKLYSEFWFES